MIKIENQPDEFEKDLEERLRIITKKIVKKGRYPSKKMKLQIEFNK